MKPPKPEGSTYVDVTLGYVREKRNGRWRLQHRLVMEGILGRELLPSEIVHHENEVKTDNRPENLSITNRSDHAIEHRVGSKSSMATRLKQSESAKRVAADPEERRRRSLRAKKQHEGNNLGRKPKSL